MQSILKIIYPPQCLLCRDRVVENFSLCGRCVGHVRFMGGLACAGCAQPLPGHSNSYEMCDACLEAPHPWQQVRAVMLYTGWTRDLILGFKNRDLTYLAQPLGTWMSNAVADILAPEALIVPVPLHWTRMVQRKYNQAGLLARVVAKRSQREFVPNLLRRKKMTRKLGKLAAQERRGILRDAISVDKPARIAGRDILLIDDVMTTGATLDQCAHACLDAGATSVNVAILARARISD